MHVWRSLALVGAIVVMLVPARATAHKVERTEAALPIRIGLEFS